jgi:hypothetical protein
MAPTTQGQMTPEGVVCFLTFRCYAYNRDGGMSAERLAKLFPASGAAMEARYQQEQRRAA